MRYARTLERRHVAKYAAAIAMMLLVAAACAAQAVRQTPPPEAAHMQDLMKNPELLAAFNTLISRFQHDLQYPGPRNQSRLLPLLPATTTFYVALPNYGDVAYQGLNIFRQELQESPALREWWQKVEATTGPKLEDSIEKFHQVSQYLGDEIILSGAMAGSDPKLLVLAEVRKPGLKEVLEQMLPELSGKSNFRVRVISPQELSAGENGRPQKELLVLVRPDFVIGSLDLTALRNLNARLESGNREFASSPFGLRVAQAYEGGATSVAAANLHEMINHIPSQPKQNQLSLQRTGLTEVKYLVWDHKSAAGQAVSQWELSFTGPRRGVASWLAAPGPLESMDFVSPHAVMVSSVRLKNPAEIFDDIVQIASAPNPNAFAALGMFEQTLGVNLRNDLLSHLKGEITLELDNVNPPKPVWKAILRVSDAARLQQTLSTLLTATHVPSEKFSEDGITYYTLRVPSPKKATEIGYAFAGGYLIVGSDPAGVADAVRVHGSGESLGQSRKFLASLPSGHPSGVSALFYEDPAAIASLRLQQLSPEIAGSLAQLTAENKPVVACAYGEEASIHGASTSPAMDAGVVLVAAAIAIPNLLRSKMAADEASAVGTIRTVVTAQVTYASIYPQRGYAPDLATLGPNPAGASHMAGHAGLVDASVANPNCAAGGWCTKSGFRFTVASVCKQYRCDDFVVIGTPVANNTGTRSFCSTSDGVLRSRAGPPLTSPINVSECRAWQPLQ